MGVDACAESSIPRFLSRLARTKLAVVIGVVFLARTVTAQHPAAAVEVFYGCCAVAVSYIVSQGYVDATRERGGRG